MKKIFFALILTVALSSMALAGVWQMSSHMLQGAADDMAVTTFKDSLGSTCIMTIGGQRGGSSLYDVTYYNPASNYWYNKAPIPKTLIGARALSISDTLVFLNGGYSQSAGSYSTTTYTMRDTGYWHEVSGLATTGYMANHGFVWLPNVYSGVYMYAVGGMTTGPADSLMERLDPQSMTKTWSKDMPAARANAVVAGALGQDGKPHIFVIGGKSFSGVLTNTVLVYDTTGPQGSWTYKTNMPGSGRWQAAGALLGGKIYVIGGIVDLIGTVTRRVDIYDPQTDTWTLGDSIPEPLCRAGAAGLNNAIYVFGGYNKTTSMQSDSVWQYRPLAPSPPPLIQPLNNALTNNNYPEFYWGSVPGCTQYRYEISSDPTFVTIDVAQGSTSDTSKLYPSIYISSGGSYFWRVKAYNWSLPDSSGWSPVRKLTLDLTGPSTPILSTPADGSILNSSNVNFSWFPVDSAVVYNLQIDNFDGLFITPLINDSTISSTGISINLTSYGGGDDLYYWRVRARDSVGNWSGWSEVPTFTVDMTAPYVTYTDPAGSAGNIPVSSPVVIGFSEGINHTSGTGFSFTCSPDPGNWIESWNLASDTVTLTHAPFVAGQNTQFMVTAATDLAGNNLVSSYGWNFTTAAASLPPRLHVQPCTSATAAYAQGFSAQVSAVKPGAVSGNWGIAGVSIRFYVPGTHTLIDSLNLSNYSDSLWGANAGSSLGGQSFPRADGLQYRIAARSDEGAVTIYPDSTQSMAAGFYHHHPVSINSTEAKNIFTIAVPNDQWRMYSFPGNMKNISIYNELSDDLGSYDPAKWRLFTWDSYSSKYLEHGGPNTCYVDNLRAFWLRHRMGGVVTIDLEATANGGLETWTSGDDNYPGALTGLPEGWTDIANPFMFPVPWDSVVYNPSLGIQGPYAFDGSDWQLPVTVSTQPMMPFRGYSYKTPVGNASSLWIMHRRAPGYKNETPALQWPQGWRGQVAVSTNDGSDGQNFFGIGAGMTLGKDAYDYSEPPKGIAGTAGYFKLEDGECAVDLRPELGDGQTWDFAVDCQGQTKLTLTLPVEFPAGTECYLADLSRQVSVNIKDNNTYSFAPEPGETVREFKIIAGKVDYAKAVLGTSFALPAVTLLAQNRPNPLRDNTSISYQLAADGPVKLAIYNVAGQLVKTIVNHPQMAGRYTVSWNGRDESGRQAATGVYFYRLTANGTSAARTMNLIK
ncbi:MAG: Ig-like domain-containing protein [bacterium]|nr:Ig-like domain-containing protein [bacterium]